MAVHNKKFIGRLNNDASDWAMPPDDYTHAGNIRVIPSEDGSEGSVHQFPGETAKVSLTTTDYEIVGKVEDQANNRAFLFYRHSTFLDGAIICYDHTNLRKWFVVPTNTSLDAEYPLRFNDWVDADITEGFLFWTSPTPMMINVDRAITTYQPEYDTEGEYEPYNDLDSLILHVIKRPPVYPLLIVESEDEDYPSNFVSKNAFQFSYYYIYKDGQKSVPSVYSHLKPIREKDNKANKISVSVPKVEKIHDDVSDIILLVRKGNNEDFFEFKRWTKNETLDAVEIDNHNRGKDSLDIDFYNDAQLLGTDGAHTSKPFDRVPVESESLTIATNRLFLANNIIGYDVPERIELTVTPVLTGTSSDDTYFWVSISCVDDNTIGWAFLYIPGSPGSGGWDKDQEYFWLDNLTTEEAYYDIIANQGAGIPSSAYIDGSGGSPAIMGGWTKDFVIDMFVRNFPECPRYEWYDYTTIETTLTDWVTPDLVDGQNIFKTGGKYNVGAIFYDGFMRHNGVTKGMEDVVVPDVEIYNTGQYTKYIRWSLDSVTGIPSWAKYYQIVISKNLEISRFFQIRDTGASWAVRSSETGELIVPSSKYDGAGGTFDFTVEGSVTGAIGAIPEARLKYPDLGQLSATDELLDVYGAYPEIAGLAVYPHGSEYAYNYKEGDLVKMHIPLESYNGVDYDYRPVIRRVVGIAGDRIVLENPFFEYEYSGDVVLTYNQDQDEDNAVTPAVGNIPPPKFFTIYDPFQEDYKYYETGEVFPTTKEGKKETTSITTVADVAGSLDGTYFILEDSNGSVAFWIDVDDSGTAEPTHGADRAVEITTILTGNGIAGTSGVGSKVYNAIIADSEFESGQNPEDGSFVVSASIVGNRDDGYDGDTGFTIAVSSQGVDVDTLAYTTVTGDVRGDIYLALNTEGARAGYDSYPTEVMCSDTTQWENWQRDIGRTSIKLYDGQTVKDNSIVWSNQRVQGTKINGYSTFDALDEKLINDIYGSIKKIILASDDSSKGQVMLAIGSHETCSVYLSRQQIFDSQEEKYLASSSEIIGSVNLLKGGYGTEDPHTVQQYKGNVYWIDRHSYAVVRYSLDGLVDLSDNRMKSFFRTLLAGGGNLITGIEPFSNQYMIYSDYDDGSEVTYEDDTEDYGIETVGNDSYGYWRNPVCVLDESAYAGAWSIPICVERDSTGTIFIAGWGTPICVKEDIEWTAEWDIEICVLDPLTYASGWGIPICVQFTTSYSASWATPICVIGVPVFTGEWSTAICVFNSNTAIGLFDLPVCVISALDSSNTGDYRNQRLTITDYINGVSVATTQYSLLDTFTWNGIIYPAYTWEQYRDLAVLDAATYTQRISAFEEYVESLHVGYVWDDDNTNEDSGTNLGLCPVK